MAAQYVELLAGEECRVADMRLVCFNVEPHEVEWFWTYWAVIDGKRRRCHAGCWMAGDVRVARIVRPCVSPIRSDTTERK